MRPSACSSLMLGRQMYESEMEQRDGLGVAGVGVGGRGGGDTDSVVFQYCCLLRALGLHLY